MIEFVLIDGGFPVLGWTDYSEGEISASYGVDSAGTAGEGCQGPPTGCCARDCNDEPSAQLGVHVEIKPRNDLGT